MIWWLIPTAATILGFVGAVWCGRKMGVFRGRGSYHDYDFASPIVELFLIVMGLVVALIAWLVYFIIV